MCTQILPKVMSMESAQREEAKTQGCYFFPGRDLTDIFSTVAKGLGSNQPAPVIGLGFSRSLQWLLDIFNESITLFYFKEYYKAIVMKVL